MNDRDKLLKFIEVNNKHYLDLDHDDISKSIVKIKIRIDNTEKKLREIILKNVGDDPNLKYPDEPKKFYERVKNIMEYKGGLENVEYHFTDKPYNFKDIVDWMLGEEIEENDDEILL